MTEPAALTYNRAAEEAPSSDTIGYAVVIVMTSLTLLMIVADVPVIYIHITRGLIQSSFCERNQNVYEM